MNKDIKLLPCPFCGCEDIEVVREGTNRQSCIVSCTECGCQLESNEIGYGYFWNLRSQEYKECIKNIQEYLRNTSPYDIENAINAFTMSSVLAIAFNKTKEKVIEDIILLGREK